MPDVDGDGMAAERSVWCSYSCSRPDGEADDDDEAAAAAGVSPLLGERSDGRSVSPQARKEGASWRVGSHTGPGGWGREHRWERRDREAKGDWRASKRPRGGAKEKRLGLPCANPADDPRNAHMDEVIGSAGQVVVADVGPCHVGEDSRTQIVRKMMGQ